MPNMQVYLGGFDNEEQAALAYDIAAIKFRVHDANTNYPISNYEQELLHFDEVSLTSCCHSQSLPATNTLVSAAAALCDYYSIV